MADNIIMKVKKYDEDIYPGESISFSITKDDGSVFSDTSTFQVEIRNNLGETTATEAVAVSGDKLSFSATYTDTSGWTRAKEYSLWGRLKDSATSYDNVVLDITLDVQ